VTAVRDLTQIIKAYDVRGVYPDQLDAELAERVGAAFAQVVGASRSAGGPGAVVVGRDMRPSGPELVAAFCAGVTGQGVDVVDIGLASTDQL
jgi:phosphomannomutase